jgi:hypothetical protein
MAKFTIMESRRAGTCNVCRGPIREGQLIEWNRTEGARHYAPSNPDCKPNVASDEEKKLYAKDVAKAISEWDGVGSFAPITFGDWVHNRA